MTGYLPTTQPYRLICSESWWLSSAWWSNSSCSIISRQKLIISLSKCNSFWTCNLDSCTWLGFVSGCSVWPLLTWNVVCSEGGKLHDARQTTRYGNSKKKSRKDSNMLKPIVKTTTKNLATLSVWNVSDTSLFEERLLKAIGLKCEITKQ